MSVGVNKRGIKYGVMIVIIGCMLGCLGEWANQYVEVSLNYIEDEWEIDLPEPYKIDKIISYKGFSGEGISYTVLQYKEDKEMEKISQMIGWKEKDQFVKKQIDKCLKFLDEWYEVKLDEQKTLNKYKNRLVNSYKYYYVEDTDGISYGVFIWFEEVGEMHIIDHTF